MQFKITLRWIFGEPWHSYQRACLEWDSFSMVFGNVVSDCLDNFKYFTTTSDCFPNFVDIKSVNWYSHNHRWRWRISLALVYQRNDQTQMFPNKLSISSNTMRDPSTCKKNLITRQSLTKFWSPLQLFPRIAKKIWLKPKIFPFDCFSLKFLVTSIA